jgi:hypothetical protein
MTVDSKQVLRGNGNLTESFAKRLIADAVRRVALRHDLTDRDLADLIACSPETIGNARNQDNKLQAHTLFNLLSVDPLALEGLLHHFGRRSVQIEAKCDGDDELVTTAGAVHKLAAVKAANSPGGAKVTDYECLEIEPEIDAALESLSALKSRCERIRIGRAA